MPGDYGGTGGAAREACRGIRGRACSCNTRSDSLQRRRLAGGTLPSSSETSSKDVTDILCEVRLGDCGASSAAGWAAVSAAGGAVCVLCSSASGTGSLCSSAPSTLASAGTSGTSASASCSGTPEPDDSRLLSSGGIFERVLREHHVSDSSCAACRARGRHSRRRPGRSCASSRAWRRAWSLPWYIWLERQAGAAVKLSSWGVGKKARSGWRACGDPGGSRSVNRREERVAS
jgi:hypothetical protein